MHDFCTFRESPKLMIFLQFRRIHGSCAKKSEKFVPRSKNHEKCEVPGGKSGGPGSVLGGLLEGFRNQNPGEIDFLTPQKRAPRQNPRRTRKIVGSGEKNRRGRAKNSFFAVPRQDFFTRPTGFFTRPTRFFMCPDPIGGKNPTPLSHPGFEKSAWR